MIERTLSEQEMVVILEEIAREGKNSAAQIAAIRALREMDAGSPAKTGFDLLDEVGAQRGKRAG